MIYSRIIIYKLLFIYILPTPNPSSSLKYFPFVSAAEANLKQLCNINKQMEYVDGILEGIGLLIYAENNNRRNNNLGLNNACLVLCLLSLFFFFLLAYQMVENSHL